MWYDTVWRQCPVCLGLLTGGYGVQRYSSIGGTQFVLAPDVERVLSPGSMVPRLSSLTLFRGSRMESPVHWTFRLVQNLESCLIVLWFITMSASVNGARIWYHKCLQKLQRSKLRSEFSKILGNAYNPLFQKSIIWFHHSTSLANKRGDR